eukprot:3657677-Prymnesium_polylepis.2
MVTGCTPSQEAERGDVQRLRALAYAAAFGGHVECLGMLKELGVNLSAGPSGGCTPAHLAARRGHADCFGVLKELGVSLSAPDNEGWTPAIVAALLPRAECLRALHGFE